MPLQEKFYKNVTVSLVSPFHKGKKKNFKGFKG